MEKGAQPVSDTHLLANEYTHFVRNTGSHGGGGDLPGLRAADDTATSCPASLIKVLWHLWHSMQGAGLVGQGTDKHQWRHYVRVDLPQPVSPTKITVW